MPTNRVLLGTPTLDFKVHARYAHSLAATTRMAAERGVFLREILMSGDAIVQNARNDLVKLALEHDFDDLIFIDADQDWEPEWIFRLLDYPVDCVGAPVRKKTDDEELYNVRTAHGPFGFVKHQNHRILTAPDMALGTGFIRYSRKALQLLWDNSEEYRILGQEPKRWIFDIRPQNGLLIGEDTHVSNKLRSLGVQTWVDPTMTPGHMGEKRWAGNFELYLAKQQQQALSEIAA